ncbi:TnsA endonuclease N-terminal domain-containing protein [Sporomusa sphaeroides]|uniref:TnsA endonuclease N-terminal domain-containing protein n=1 Tax=Sporomusa sphaeroides TaxID=47679 RepID=UPI002B6AC0F0|nr:TnsA endonuclease N-terminal domain-containing protein [Sporomusa sphaeroides]HML31961.1 TnsA endonuclease N-terminal domain-containing protein [Sporomusa sphaeroides]
MKRKLLTLQQIEKKLSAGYGSGRGINYKPFIKVQNIASSTTVSRIRGLKVKRIYHLFSFLEVACFYIMDSKKLVLDIREQVPLITLSSTLEIATRLKIVHPGLYRGGKNPQMMTTDFLVDVMEEGRLRLVALCVKPSGLLSDKRVKEKLEIERFYWLERGIDWRIVTEKEIPLDLIKNLQWLYSARNWYSVEPPYQAELITYVEQPLIEALKNNLPFSIIALAMDKKLVLKPGTCLDVFRYLVALGYWKVDMLTFIDTAKPISVTQNMKFTVEGGEVGAGYSCN